MKSLRIFALASIAASVIAVVPAYASSSASAYEFMASEWAKTAEKKTIAAEKATLGKEAAERLISCKPVATSIDETANEAKKSAGKRKSTRHKTLREKPTVIAPSIIAKAEPAAPRSRIARKPLGYHAPSRDRYRALIAKYAEINGVPFAFGDAVMRVESRYQPHVTNRGAIGLMQIKHSTARDLGYKGDVEGLKTPEVNIKYGMKYLGQAYRLANGDTCGTVMRYQSGHYAKRINRANLDYCAKVRTIIASLAGETKTAALQPTNKSTVID